MVSLEIVGNKQTLPIDNSIIGFTRFVVLIIFWIDASTNWIQTVQASLRALLKTWAFVKAVYNLVKGSMKLSNLS